ncbi:hypothetical protein BOTBODRAFT_591216 [Botryobasidium botryosum FD-172 SS1]|uniref:Uncharacterized protein n=1 Tax=Botryobasidium botryosum (strain FD-172 SS1) TaxID=930990 RepID=A0A067LZT2_BOTB1|nr:hypothetical protein BOTBODRAFT_591216 [Botryobasidium botryosum FD-172 SS1]
MWVVIDPTSLRCVTGNVLAVATHRAVWSESFRPFLKPHWYLFCCRREGHALASWQKSIQKMVTRPTIESSFAMHSTKSIPEFNHPKHPVLRVAIEVLELRRHRKFPSIRGASLAYGANISLN